MKSKIMFISKLQISGLLLTSLLVLHGCGDSDELDKVTVTKQNTVNQTQQQMQPTTQPTYIPANPYGATQGQAPGNFRPDNQRMNIPQQYGGGYSAQPQVQSAPTYNSYAPVNGGNTRGNPWSQQGATVPSSGAYQGMNQQPQQAPNAYPSTGYQQPAQPQFQYRPLESTETKSSTEAANQRYQAFPPPMQYGYPSYSQPVLPYGGMPGGGYPGYNPYGGYGYPQPGNIGMPSISFPGVW